MQTYELLVKNRSVKANSDDTTLVRTSIGIDQIHVLFDNAEWLAFPLTVTFAQRGVTPITRSLTVSAVSGSSEWVAESTVVIPYEVITMVGAIRITFQGTDANGNHIITAFGAPLRVEESGDVTMGELPSDAPTVSEWEQWRAQAQATINNAQTLVNNLQGRIDEMVAEAKRSLDDEIATGISVATDSSLGVIQVGDGLSITEGGILSTLATNGMTASQAFQLANLAMLAAYGFDTTFDESGVLQDSVTIKPKSVPVDGETITVNEDGKLCMALTFADEGVY